MNTPSQAFKIVSFNVFGAPFQPQKIIRSFFRNKVRRRFEKIAQELEKGEYDLLCFQEVLTYPHFLFLRKHLPSFPYVAYERSLYGPKGGLVIFTKIPFEKVEYIKFRKSGVYWNKSITGPLTRKGMLLMKVAKEPMWLINTHLTQNSDWNWNASNRFAKFLVLQLEQCADTVKTLSAIGNKIFLAGDFNLSKDSALYRDFVKDANLVDVFAKDNFPTTHPEFAPKGRKLERIDYMFTTKKNELKIIQKKYLFTDPIEMSGGKKSYLSDHIALSASFR